MITIHLGVTELPYAHGPPARRRRGKPPKPAQVSTGDVAEWLEARYHVMEHFVQLHGAEIAGALEHGLAGALETMLMGGPAPAAPSLIASAAGPIEEMFRRMIEARELDRLGYPGIPTAASLAGVSQRFKRRRGPPRPSFVDTGLYVASFKVWADD